MDRLIQDLRFAFRLFRKDRAFALTTILTLALCIGANTAIFTIVRSVLLRPLPYPESERLVFLYEAFPGAGVERAGTSVPNYFDRLAFTDVFESQALYQSRGFRVGQGAGAEGVASMSVSPSFFNVLKTAAARGRGFNEEEGTPGKNEVTVLSWSFAKRQPGGVDGIVGRELVMNDERYTVVGVMPETFTFLNPEVRLWVPLAFTAEERGDDRRYSQNHDEIARLAPGATLAQARQRLDAQAARNVENAGPLKSALVNAGYRSEIRLVLGRSRAQRPIGAPVALGWRRVSAPHCRRQHHQPLARPRDRPHEGSGHEACARRGQSSRRPSTGDRNDAADVVWRCVRSGAWVLEPWRIEVSGARRHPTRARDSHGRGRGAVHSRVGGCTRRDRRRRAGHAPCGRQPQPRPARGRPNGYGRPRRTQPYAVRSSSRRSRWRSYC